MADSFAAHSFHSFLVPLHSSIPAVRSNNIITKGHETVGVVAAMGPKAKGFSVGDRVCADNSELCGECFCCRRGQELLCENFEAHGVTMDGGFAEYCAYPAIFIQFCTALCPK
jgi:D-arabinose 1-dehydrogenase-like Zn-dependent alcohol dehydrogenase